MNGYTWTNKYRPKISDIPQDDVRDEIQKVSKTDMNIIVGGPKGVGKTSYTSILLNEVHNSGSDVIRINVSDLFSQTKKEIQEDPRFSKITDSNLTKRQLLQDAIKNISSYSPVTGGFRTVILDNYESVRNDFQNALRRDMEIYSDNTQFVICTRDRGKIIDPIKSRCYTLQVRPPNSDEITEIVDYVDKQEDLEYTNVAVKYLWSSCRPNVRKFILYLQMAQKEYEEISTENVNSILGSVNIQDEIDELLSLVDNEDFKEVRDQIEYITGELGYSYDNLLREIIEYGMTNFSNDDITSLCSQIGEIDVRIQDSLSPTTQISELLLEWKY